MENQENNDKKPKKRSLTELTLGWIAERLRKTEAIKEAIHNGKYDVDSKRVADSLVKPE